MLKLCFCTFSFFLFPKLWSLQHTSGHLEELLLFSDFVNCVVFSPNGKRVIAAADNGMVVSQHLLFLLQGQESMLAWERGLLRAMKIVFM